MATSRTGTGKWKRLRGQALQEAKRQGQTHCPLCRAPLDWTRALDPHSPEVDHIRPHALGGTDDTENVRVICRACNTRMGGQLGRALRAQRTRIVKAEAPVTTFDW